MNYANKVYNVRDSARAVVTFLHPSDVCWR